MADVDPKGAIFVGKSTKPELLSLPFAPRHEDGTCEPAAPLAEKREAVPPLGGLATLRKTRTGD